MYLVKTCTTYFKLNIVMTYLCIVRIILYIMEEYIYIYEL